MDHRIVTALAVKLLRLVDLSKPRVETLSLLILGIFSARTVNLSHLACERAGGAMIASTYRRFQRFFQHVHLPQDWACEKTGLARRWPRWWGRPIRGRCALTGPIGWWGGSM